MRFVAFHSIIILSLSLMLTISCAPNQIELVTAYQNAHNRHDIEAALAYYADNIRFEITGTWVKEGLEEIRGLEEWDAAVDGELLLYDMTLENDTITCKGAERNEWFRLAGIDEVSHVSVTIRVLNNRIVEIIAKPTLQSEMEIADAFGKIMSWARRERSEMLSALMPGGQLEYTTEAAESWLDLLRDWRNATTD